MREEKPKMLVVDDEPINRELYQAVFKRDYEVTTVVSGESALKHAFNRPPDIILLDLMLPKMDGYEVIRELKGNEMTKDIPVILMTAYMISKFEIVHKVENFSKDNIYIKPFDILKIRKRISQLINQPKHAPRELIG